MADLSASPPWRAAAAAHDNSAPQTGTTLPEAIRPPMAMRWAVVALLVGLLTTQRIAISVGSGSFGASLPLTYALLAVLLLYGRLVLDATALMLYGAIAMVAVASFWFNTGDASGEAVSVSSLLLMLTLYLPFVFVMASRPDNPGHWLWTIRMVGNVLLFAAIAGIVQFYAQFFVRASWLFDVSELIPAPIRGQGVFNSKIAVGSMFKANGFFFREPSGFSYMMAFGLLIELALFRRLVRMLCFGLALLLSYSGTGLLALAIGLVLPFRAAMLFKLGIGAAVVLVGNALAGDPLNLAYTLSRAGEFGAEGSSAYMRYVAPLHLVDAGIDVTPWSALLGHGPGTILKIASIFDAHDPTWAKLLFEYGIAGFVLFLGLMLYKLAACPAPLQLRAVAFASWLVMGGHLLSPENVCFFFALFGLWPRAGSERADAAMGLHRAAAP
jgi:hypothetical protein